MSVLIAAHFRVHHSEQGCWIIYSDGNTSFLMTTRQEIENEILIAQESGRILGIEAGNLRMGIDDLPLIEDVDQKTEVGHAVLAILTRGTSGLADKIQQEVAQKPNRVTSHSGLIN